MTKSKRKPKATNATEMINASWNLVEHIFGNVSYNHLMMMKQYVTFVCHGARSFKACLTVPQPNRTNCFKNPAEAHSNVSHYFTAQHLTEGREVSHCWNPIFVAICHGSQSTNECCELNRNNTLCFKAYICFFLELKRTSKQISGPTFFCVPSFREKFYFWGILDLSLEKAMFCLCLYKRHMCSALMHGIIYSSVNKIFWLRAIV